MTDSGPRETAQANRPCPATTALSPPVNVPEFLESLEVGMWELQRCETSCYDAVLVSRLLENCGYNRSAGMTPGG